MARSAEPIGLIRSRGMMLPGNGRFGSRIADDDGGQQRAEVACLHGRRGHGARDGDAFLQAQALVAEEEERLVPDDRPTDRAAELVAVVVGHAGLEVVLRRADRRIADEVERGAVVPVRSRLDGRDDLSARQEPVLGRIQAGQHRHLLDRVEGRAEERRRRHAVVVVEAVQDEVVLCVAGPRHVEAADGDVPDEPATTPHVILRRIAVSTITWPRQAVRVARDVPRALAGGLLSPRPSVGAPSLIRGTPVVPERPDVAN